eukprot:g32540.t1
MSASLQSARPRLAAWLAGVPEPYLLPAAIAVAGVVLCVLILLLALLCRNKDWVGTKGLPYGVVNYKTTSSFTYNTVPTGLLADHNTGKGIWGRIVVEKGKLQYTLQESGKSYVLQPGLSGIAQPQEKHAVKLLDETIVFHVEFFRYPITNKAKNR